MTNKFKLFIDKRFEPSVFTGLPLSILITIFLIFLATFIGITDSIVNSYPIVTLDKNFAQFLYSIRTPFLAQVFYIITTLGNQISVTIFLLLSLLYLRFKKETIYMYSLLIAFVGTEASVLFVKILTNRDRPLADIAYYIEKTKSFPSFHSAMAVTFFGFCTYYITRHIQSKRSKFPIIVAGGALILLIGFSRLYLGVHFLSDVLGGFLMGGLWLVIAISFREERLYKSSLQKSLE
jgi:membrane-associated phospholipid phosphatase